MSTLESTAFRSKSHFRLGTGPKIWQCLAIAIIFLVSNPFAQGAQRKSRTANYIVREGQARSVIVINTSAAGLYRLAAEEVQRYIGRLTGVEPPIVAPEFRELPERQLVGLQEGRSGTAGDLDLSAVARRGARGPLDDPQRAAAKPEHGDRGVLGLHTLVRQTISEGRDRFHRASHPLQQVD